MTRLLPAPESEARRRRAWRRRLALAHRIADRLLAGQRIWWVYTSTGWWVL